jgi:hypothetical protein
VEQHQHQQRHLVQVEHQHLQQHHLVQVEHQQQHQQQHQQRHLALEREALKRHRHLETKWKIPEEELACQIENPMGQKLIGKLVLRHTKP